jgi:uncharacterized protein involved in exopolysaccharide biosynthesis
MEAKEAMPDQARDPNLEVHWNFARPVRRILNGKRILLISTAAGFFLGLILVLVWKPYYTSEAVFLPPKSDVPNSTPSSLMLFGADDKSDTYLGMLASRSVADKLIDELGLVSEFHATDRDIARSILANSSNFSLNKNTMIIVQVKARTGKLSADIANAYLDALYELNGEMVTSASAHRRMFFEQQLQEQKLALSQAEVDLKATQERTGIVLPVGEAEAGLTATAQLQAQINAAETRLAGLRVGATESNPEVVQLRTQINQLRSQLAHQQTDSAARGPGAGLTSQRRLPEFTLEYQQKQHEVKLRETVYDALVQQYEKARLSSIDPGPQLQIVDRAIAPNRKSGPPRKIILLAGIVSGFLFGLLYILTADLIRNFFAALRMPLPAEPR